MAVTHQFRPSHPFDESIPFLEISKTPMPQAHQNISKTRLRKALPRGMEADGHKVLSVKPINQTDFEIILQKQ